MNQGQSEDVAKGRSKCEPCDPSVNQAPATILPLQLVGEPVWSDEFDSGSTPSNDFWNYDIGRGSNNDGWGNWEVQHYANDSSNVNLSGGKLNINVLKGTHNGETYFTSGRINTNGKLEFQYGSVEASIKLPDCNGGLWLAFWLLGSNIQDVGWPKCGELDILEAGNKDSIADGVVNKRVSSAAHWSVDDNYAVDHKALTADFDLNSDFHTDRMDWTAEFVNTFVDGSLMWSFAIGGCNDTHCTEFHQPFYFILNVAVGGIFTGITDKNQIFATTPGQMQIDYIRVYNNEVVNAQLYGADIKRAPPVNITATTPNATPKPASSTTHQYRRRL
jgi:beta-glucanase (GH16 family)